ncbi:transcriptional regulator [Streptomyces sp. S.PB5]|uniref:transcriptional regulator n=1 Tax=Streptomyces sp. S.PB5 TaxID=3020844 RepID=UPI0025B216EE|nr:transcriptional regulator [Streptomyces sp. S.PB5]MDN3021768.1 helix-turn-helix domain-containing protein [Streptomyces sp. S.PB5]
MSGQDGAHEVAEFAALLTRLKERTDRSYGQLARRLHMNTSTLHRYCAGDAVPVDFAPVERFAALCGATPEERLELHRLWLPAVAARQRPRTPVAKETEPAAEKEVGGAPNEAASVPDAAASDSADTGTGAADGDTGTGTSDGDAGAGSDEVAGAAVQVGNAAPVRVRPWYRRRRVLVTSAVAVASAVTLAGLSALSDNDRSSSADSVRPTDPGRTSSGGPMSPGPSSSKKPPSSSPSPGRTSASPSPGTGSRATAAPSAKGTGSPTGGAGPGAAVPLTWTVNSHVWYAGCGHHYVIDRPSSQVPPPPTAQDAAVWASAEGALHGGNTMVQISVQGRSSTAVVLEALRVRVVQRAAPAEGNSYAMDNGCGGALTPREFSVDLDADRPVAHSVPGHDGENEIPAIRMPYRVSAEDPEVLLVTARTVTCDCSWYLELDWSSQGRADTVRIDDGGKPFRTTADKKLPQYSYDTDARKWVPGS